MRKYHNRLRMGKSSIGRNEVLRGERIIGAEMGKGVTFRLALHISVLTHLIYTLFDTCERQLLKHLRTFRATLVLALRLMRGLASYCPFGADAPESPLWECIFRRAEFGELEGNEFINFLIKL